MTTSPATPHVIEVRDLCKTYNGKLVIDHLSFTVQPGVVTGFLGPNGAGKSTTMRLIVGLDRPTSGDALIGGVRYVDLVRPLVAGIIAFVLVLAPLTQLIPGSIGDHVFAYLPTSAGQLMVNARQGPDDLLTPWQGFGVMCLWTIGLMLLANFLLRRRDA